jgi:hypothetical protein
LIAWMGPILFDTLLLWADIEEKHCLRWSIPNRMSVVAHLDEPEPLRFEVTGWPLLRMTRRDFENQARKEFEVALHDYIGKCQAKAEEIGWLSLPRSLFEEHMEWLVKYQVQRKSQDKIRREANRTRQTVAEAIKNAARLVAGFEYLQWLRPRLPPGPRLKGQN